MKKKKPVPTEAALDTERLTWLEANRPQVMFHNLDRYVDVFLGAKEFNGLTLREAIDAARAAEAKKPA
jgi:hypothetical protein